MGLAVESEKVGSLVWVQRKNGRWWPGKIESCFKSKTAVKLLGRENGSVEWFNLENSNRVKAFRSVEFNDFIRSAELLYTDNYKKNGKYANREDAILHALSLEKQVQARCHKRQGELKQSGLYRGKRSRCAYWSVESNSHVNRSVLHSRSMKVSSTSCKLDKNSPKSSQGEVQDSSELAPSDISESSSEDSSGAKNGQLTGSYMNGRQTSITNARKKESFSNSSKSSLDNMFAGGTAKQNWNLKGRCYSHDSSGGSPDTKTEGEGSIMSRKRACNSQDQGMLDADFLEESSHKLAKKSSRYSALEVDMRSDSSYKEEDSGSESFGCEPMLVDVHITVQANNRKEQVPLVSLMSKTGKVPIIGYPIEVEVLHSKPENLLPWKGSSCHMIDNFGSKLHQPVWRTSKRTPVCYTSILKSSANQTTEAKENVVLPAKSSLQKPPRKGHFPLQSGHDFTKRMGSIPSEASCVPVNLIFSKLFCAISK